MRPTESTTHDASRLRAEESILAGGGVMGAVMRAHEWTASPLGPVSAWPPSLRTTVSLTLNSQFPTIIFWGPDFVMLYNDAYMPILADKHPTALGRPARELWSEIWSIVGPMLHGVLTTGEATWSSDLFLPIIHNGAVGEHYFTFSYSPIRDEDGAVRGVFCPVTETTARLLGERREQRLRAEADAARDEVTHVLESMHDRFVAFDSQWRITAINASAAAAMHHRREELLGQVYWDVFLPTRETNLYPEFHRAMTERVAVEFESYYPPWECWYDVRVYPTITGGLSVFFRDITARKQAEMVLQDSEERLRLATDSAGVGIWHYYLREDRLLWSPQFKRLFGLPPDDSKLTYEKFLTHVHPEDRSRMGQLRELLAEGEDFEVEYRVVWPDGRVHWIGAMGRTFHAGSGEAVGYRGVATDITARKQAEEERQRSEERLRYALDAAHMVAWEWEAETEKITQSPNINRVMGLPAGMSITNRHEFFALVHPDDRDRLLTTLQTSLQAQTAYTLEFRLCSPDGVTRWMEDHGRPRLSAAGKLRSIMGVIVDITARKQAEEERQRATALLQAVSETTAELIYVKDQQNRLLFGNPSLFRTMGKTPEEIMDRSDPEWYQDLAQAEAVVASDRRVMTTGRAETLEETVTTPAGLRTFLSTKAPYYDVQGAVVGLVGVSTDITTRKAAETERERLLAELQRINAEFQQFAHIVSHDLNEPLRTMSNYVQLLARRLQGKLDDSATDYMTFVTDAAKRMQQLLTDLLAYTKAGQTQEFQAVDCEAVLTQVLTALQTRITECEAVITHDPLPTVQGDATRIGQVLQNLIGNALKFCEEKSSRVHISAIKEDHHWKFSVRDNGIGIDPQQAGKLFQVFQRLHSRSEYAGTGIGLAICKKIVEQHGGRIWVESKPREGSMFHFTVSDGEGRTTFR